MQKRTFVGMLAGAVLAMTALPVLAQSTIVVGGKNFTEQLLLTEMTAQLLESKGYTVQKNAGLGSAAVRQAQEAGQIDVYWEYTGTSLITYNSVTDKLDADATYAKVAELDAAKGLTWLAPSAANNTYGLAMRRADAEARGITTLSQLAALLNGGETLTLGSNAEFYSRPDGLAPLEAAYGFSFGRENVSRMDSGLVYQALRDSQVDVGLVFATDGRIPAFDFVVLEDDLGYFPAYALAPVVRTETLEANPELQGQLEALSAVIDDATMANLNAQVDVEQKTIEEVATAFLTEKGLI